jgi:hypothetical protein
MTIHIFKKTLSAAAKSDKQFKWFANLTKYNKNARKSHYVIVHEIEHNLYISGVMTHLQKATWNPTGKTFGHMHEISSRDIHSLLKTQNMVAFMYPCAITRCNLMLHFTPVATEYVNTHLEKIKSIFYNRYFLNYCVDKMLEYFRGSFLLQPKFLVELEESATTTTCKNLAIFNENCKNLAIYKESCKSLIIYQTKEHGLMLIKSTSRSSSAEEVFNKLSKQKNQGHKA